MEILIRKMQRGDAEIVTDMMRRFYNSPALITNGSEKIFTANVENCLGGSPYVEGFVFVDDGKIIGYGMTARSYSTEFGGECIWIEDIYVEAEYRGRGIGSQFIRYVKAHYPEKILRLEAEADNTVAVTFYKHFGFKELPYLELVCSGD
ncbi:MAG: GNAT family N-acetyltransferase [Selenomonadaceae bacterium]|nr:GNAT family N-acetyltransferase [Selenomonadaceae bacterium]